MFSIVSISFMLSYCIPSIQIQEIDTVWYEFCNIFYEFYLGCHCENNRYGFSLVGNIETSISSYQKRTSDKY